MDGRVSGRVRIKRGRVHLREISHQPPEYKLGAFSALSRTSKTFTSFEHAIVVVCAVGDVPFQAHGAAVVDDRRALASAI
jgi:hypothetical protein